MTLLILILSLKHGLQDILTCSHYYNLYNIKQITQYISFQITAIVGGIVVALMPEESASTPEGQGLSKKLFQL